MSITSRQGQFPANGSAPSFTDMTDLGSTEVSFGYHQEDVAEGQAAVEHNKAERRGPIGWWNRHKLLTMGVSAAVAANLAFLPMVQNAALVVLGHVL
ncbi:hypothetical protein ACIP5Y_23335 [Nocardia sp. NPDC088792]|uniref:hypothetical protein n=1 Tax=Nocardia sp. NPDC088792 TaxID=3364332 RepID=UPI003823A65E